jgi:hypothetical protein
LAPVQQTGVMAIVQLALHDAVNSVTRRFDTYRKHGAADEVGARLGRQVAQFVYRHVLKEK